MGMFTVKYWFGFTQVFAPTVTMSFTSGSLVDLMIWSAIGRIAS
jgi:hypothetical protein